MADCPIMEKEGRESMKSRGFFDGDTCSFWEKYDASRNICVPSFSRSPSPLMEVPVAFAVAVAVAVAVAAVVVVFVWVDIDETLLSWPSHPNGFCIWAEIETERLFSES